MILLYLQDMFLNQNYLGSSTLQRFGFFKVYDCMFTLVGLMDLFALFFTDKVAHTQGAGESHTCNIRVTGIYGRFNLEVSWAQNHKNKPKQGYWANLSPNPTQYRVEFKSGLFSTGRNLDQPIECDVHGTYNGQGSAGWAARSGRAVSAVAFRPHGVGPRAAGCSAHNCAEPIRLYRPGPVEPLDSSRTRTQAQGRAGPSHRSGRVCPTASSFDGKQSIA
ncbi:hypothetical protein C4D60_Mb07t15050 [Musa balbisiana]|uniref:Uncharacterized protein n=1 Tax=Musa balbisiana TaxID=52838 RepID=A0A4S8JHW4_MUSBA|nr:hypothetical protein C4D60_Mb07t15050 [Musa balbisiana]